MTPNAFIGTPKEAAAKSNEAEILKENPELAVRDGPNLVIKSRRKTLVTYTDDPKGCDRYILERAIRVRDPQTGNMEPIALVACHFGTTINRYLVLPNSDKYVVTDDVAASPNGRFLATSDSTVTKARGAFIIIDWPDTEHRAEFAAGCKNIQWQNDNSLTAHCWRSEHPNTVNPNESDAIFFKARVWREGGNWRMKGIEQLERDTLKPIDSTRPLPSLTAANKIGIDAPE